MPPPEAAGKSTAAAGNVWILFEDEASQSLKPPRARTWGRVGVTPVVSVRGRGSGRVSMAGMACFKPGQRSRFLYSFRVHRGRKGEPKAFTWQRMPGRRRPEPGLITIRPTSRIPLR